MGPGKLAKHRRLSQVGFFILFMLLLLRTEFRGSVRGTANDIRLPYPVRLFFELDPLVGLSNALASHALYRGLLWSLLIIVGTLFLGRFFCGWICPMGSIHHFFGNLKSESKRGKQLFESNRYKRWQTTKYYILFAAAGSVCGWIGTGWLGRSVFVSGAVAGTVDPTRTELCPERRIAIAGAQRLCAVSHCRGALTCGSWRASC